MLQKNEFAFQELNMAEGDTPTTLVARIRQQISVVEERLQGLQLEKDAMLEGQQPNYLRVVKEMMWRQHPFAMQLLQCERRINESITYLQGATSARSMAIHADNIIKERGTVKKHKEHAERLQLENDRLTAKLMRLEKEVVCATK